VERLLRCTVFFVTLSVYPESQPKSMILISGTIQLMTITLGLLMLYSVSGPKVRQLEIRENL
jgi:hypothetical protein